MPTYQYACTSDECGLRFERVQSFTEDAISTCPNCSERVRKVYGSVGVVFKGSGFYRNDSRDAKSSGEPSKSESSSESSAKSEGSSKSESSSSDKPAADKPKTDSTAAAASKSGTSETKKSTPVAS